MMSDIYQCFVFLMTIKSGVVIVLKPTLAWSGLAVDGGRPAQLTDQPQSSVIICDLVSYMLDCSPLPCWTWSPPLSGPSGPSTRRRSSGRGGSWTLW